MSSRYLALHTTVKLVRYEHEYTEISHIAKKIWNPRQHFIKSLLNYTDITNSVITNLCIQRDNFQSHRGEQFFYSKLFLNCQQSAIPINKLGLKNKLSNIFFKFTLRLFQVANAILFNSQIQKFVISKENVFNIR